jgi:hypothetical protein
LAIFVTDEYELIARSAPEERERLTQKMSSRFDMKKPFDLPTTFTGIPIRRTNAGYAAGMTDYIARLQLLPDDCA